MISIEKEKRPWGQFFVIHDESNYKLKRIEVNSGGRLSYQFHHKRSEAWTIVEGEGHITIDGISKDYYNKALSKLTSVSVKSYFGTMVKGDVIRYELPNLNALNFMLYDSLEGGGSETLINDAQGKTFGQAMLMMEIDIDD